MRTILKVSLILLVLCQTAIAQNFKTVKGHIWFVSNAPLQTIEGHNHHVQCELNPKRAEISFSLNMTQFEFDTQTMQDHFNANYAQSELYPKALFKGFIKNIANVNFDKDSIYHVDIEGMLTIHGTTNPVKQTGIIKVKNGEVCGRCEFHISLSDFGIIIPQPVATNISNDIDIYVDILLESFGSTKDDKCGWGK